jgi:hypothetical protein
MQRTLRAISRDWNTFQRKPGIYDSDERALCPDPTSTRWTQRGHQRNVATLVTTFRHWPNCHSLFAATVLTPSRAVPCTTDATVLVSPTSLRQTATHTHTQTHEAIWWVRRGEGIGGGGRTAQRYKGYTWLTKFESPQTQADCPFNYWLCGLPMIVLYFNTHSVHTRVRVNCGVSR